MVTCQNLTIALNRWNFVFQFCSCWITVIQLYEWRFVKNIRLHFFFPSSFLSQMSNCKSFLNSIFTFLYCCILYYVLIIPCLHLSYIFLQLFQDTKYVCLYFYIRRVCNCGLGFYLSINIVFMFIDIYLIWSWYHFNIHVKTFHNDKACCIQVELNWLKLEVVILKEIIHLMILGTLCMGREMVKF